MPSLGGILLIVVLLTGCLTTPAGTRTTATDSTTGTEFDFSGGSPDDSTSPASANGACDAVASFWGMGDGIEKRWGADLVRIGWYVPAHTDVFFVVRENDIVLGSTYVTTEEKAVIADGAGIRLDKPLHGTHTLRLVTYIDANGNGQLDPNVDIPCRHDEENDDESVTINFSALDTDGTVRATPESENGNSISIAEKTTTTTGS